MIRSTYLIGRILAALGGLLVVATVILTLVAFNSSDCGEPDCDDSERDDAVGRVIILLPISVLLGAAGVALIYDTYQKV